MMITKFNLYTENSNNNNKEEIDSFFKNLNLKTDDEFISFIDNHEIDYSKGTSDYYKTYIFNIVGDPNLFDIVNHFNSTINIDVWLKYILDDGAKDYINETNRNESALILTAFNASRQTFNDIDENIYFKCVKILIDYDADWISEKRNDFLYYLSTVYYGNTTLKDIIIKDYPEKYKRYLMKKKAKEFNL